MFNRRMDYTQTLKMHNLTPKIQTHLANVYQMTAATIAAAAAGCYLHLKMHIGSPLFALGLFGLIFALYSTPNSPANQQKRTGMLLAFGALQGLVVGPLVEAVLDIDSSIVLT